MNFADNSIKDSLMPPFWLVKARKLLQLQKPPIPCACGMKLFRFLIFAVLRFFSNSIAWKSYIFIDCVALCASWHESDKSEKRKKQFMVRESFLQKYWYNIRLNRTKQLSWTTDGHCPSQLSIVSRCCLIRGYYHVKELTLRLTNLKYPIQPIEPWDDGLWGQECWDSSQLSSSRITNHRWTRWGGESDCWITAESMMRRSVRFKYDFVYWHLELWRWWDN